MEHAAEVVEKYYLVLRIGWWASRVPRHCREGRG